MLESDFRRKHVAETQRPRRSQLVREFVFSWREVRDSMVSLRWLKIRRKEEGFFKMVPNQSFESKIKYIHVASDGGYEDEDSFERLFNVAPDDWWSMMSINKGGRLRPKGWNFYPRKHTSTFSHPRDFLILFKLLF
ncbi:hypothetical protein PIB30_013391 [Stylosanthes scabra]|uniref:Uncharacterized protein n=1 Tax=Stylosanthes scabra TaxID=79078 RepID=A0ABU6W702_9FABA|nr:hypothetical protein [Stylosanthes scabra]